MHMMMMTIKKLIIIYSHTSHNGISPSTINSPSQLSCLTLVHATWFRLTALSVSRDRAIAGDGVATFVTVKPRTLRFRVTPWFIRPDISGSATAAGKMEFRIPKHPMEAIRCSEGFVVSRTSNKTGFKGYIYRTSQKVLTENLEWSMLTCRNLDG